MTRLLFDPGDKWEYGSKLDWCGLIVEHCGKRLGEVMKERIFAPLRMEDIAFSLTSSHSDVAERWSGTERARAEEGDG